MSKPTILEERIEQMEEFIEEGKLSRLNPNKVVLDKDILLKMLEEFRELVPTEIARSQHVLQTQQAILSEARRQAEDIADKANLQARETLDANEIVKLAQRRAEDIRREAEDERREIEAKADALLQKAHREAREVRIGAMEYTQDTMTGLENYIKEFHEAQKETYTTLFENMREDLRDLATNKNQVTQQINRMTNITKHTGRTVEEFRKQNMSEENN